MSSPRDAPGRSRRPSTDQDGPQVFYPANPTEPQRPTRSRRRRRKKHKGYAADLAASFLFVADLDGLIAFAVIWAVLAIQWFLLPYLFIGGAIISWVITGWYCALRFSVIASAASGEEYLGKSSADALVMRLLQWFGTWCLVVLPAILYLLATHDLSSLERASQAIGGEDVFRQIDSIAFFALLAAGVFLWPLMALCVALGGFSALSRLDLIVWTAIKTFPVYVLTAAIVLVALSVRLFTEEVEGVVGFVGSLLTIGVGVYLELFAMRVIGLYYHHYKHRFAWSWG